MEANESLADLDEIIGSFQKRTNPKNRVKRYDIKMENGCSSHETGLGLAYYSLVIQNYLNFL